MSLPAGVTITRCKRLSVGPTDVRVLKIILRRAQTIAFTELLKTVSPEDAAYLKTHSTTVMALWNQVDALHTHFHAIGELPL